MVHMAHLVSSSSPYLQMPSSSELYAGQQPEPVQWDCLLYTLCVRTTLLYKHLLSYCTSQGKNYSKRTDYLKQRLMCISVQGTIPGIVHMLSTCIHRLTAHRVSKDSKAVVLGFPGSGLWPFFPHMPVWMLFSTAVTMSNSLCWRTSHDRNLTTPWSSPRHHYSKLLESPPLLLSAKIWSYTFYSSAPVHLLKPPEKISSPFQITSFQRVKSNS